VPAFGGNKCLIFKGGTGGKSSRDGVKYLGGGRGWDASESKLNVCFAQMGNQNKQASGTVPRGCIRKLWGTPGRARVL